MNDAKKKIINKVFKVKQTSMKISSDERDGTDLGHSQQKPHQQQNLHLYHEQTYLFMKKLKKDYKRFSLFYNSCIQVEQERERRNKEEILDMKKACNQLQNEIISIKRKHWCRYCESEATYLSSVGNKFYCSQECEQKHKEFISLIQ